MKIIKRIKALFCKNNEPIEMDLIAAEIKLGKAYLHTRGKEAKTYLVRSDDIRICLSEGTSLQEREITSVASNREDKRRSAEKRKMDPQTRPDKPVYTYPGQELYRKRTFSVSLYPDEYESLTNSIKEYGYKRADFLLACVHSARKASVEKAHKQIVKTHKQKRKEFRNFQTKQAADQNNNP